MKIISVDAHDREVKGSSLEAIKRSRKETYAASRIYIWPQGETIWENLQNRRQRPYTTFKKKIIPVVLKGMGLSPETKVRWSQYAGCSCPCSPGFIIEGHYGQNIHVKIEE